MSSKWANNLNNCTEMNGKMFENLSSAQEYSTRHKPHVHEYGPRYGYQSSDETVRKQK